MKHWRQVLRSSLRPFLWQWRGVLTITPTVTGVVILLRFVGLLQAWEWAAFDQYMRLRPLDSPDNRVVIVGLDENDVNALGQAIVPDDVYAELITKLRSQSPRAIGLDIYRDLPVEPGHDDLVEVFKTTPNLVGIQKVVGEAGRETVGAPPVLAALNQVGANDIIIDADNTVRRGLLSVQAATGETVYSLSLYLALLYLEAEGIGPKRVSDDTWWLGKTLFEPFEANDGGYVRADANGYQQLINYRGSSQTFEQVSVMDVLNDEIPTDWAQDRIVLIGAVGESFQDTMHTPYSSSLLSLPEPMAGVEIHANLTSQIISAALEQRSLVRSWPEAVEWGWILLWSGAGATLVWHLGKTGATQAGGQTVDKTGSRAVVRWFGAGKVWQRGVLVVGVIATLVGVTYVPFLVGWWLPVVPAVIAAMGSATVMTAYLARSAGDIRRTFGRYLSDEIVTTLLEDPEGQKLGGERRLITILTSDLRGFTAISERLSPEMVIKVLNFYLGCMAEVITRHNGTIDEFMGDGILILFGAPIRRQDDAQRAVVCAVEMQLAMETVNKTMEDWGLSPLEMGIGIHTGEVVVGNIGSKKRAKYGVVGSPVNLTYRIESFTTGGQILISEETFHQAGEIVQVGSSQKVTPKGIAQPLDIYEVTGVSGPYELSLPRSKEVFLPLSPMLPIRFSLVEAKQVRSDSFPGRLVALSKKGALMQIYLSDELALEPLDNLKVMFLSFQLANSEDVYAKVIRRADNPHHFYISFTAMSPNVEAKLTAARTAAKTAVLDNESVASDDLGQAA